MSKETCSKTVYHRGDTLIRRFHDRERGGN